jgi:hypothetical protein
VPAALYPQVSFIFKDSLYSFLLEAALKIDSIENQGMPTQQVQNPTQNSEYGARTVNLRYNIQIFNKATIVTI